MSSKEYSKLESPERPPSLDEEGHKIWIYTAEVKGQFRKWRNIVYSILVLIYILLPWVQIKGKQAFLLDIPNRKFDIFGTTFWAHDGPLLVFIFAIIGLSLATITALWGRLWCGWACPQTVFLDFVFRKIEYLLEGTHLQRRNLDREPPSLKKITIKTTKWLLYIFTSFLISQIFLSYFMPTSDILGGLQFNYQLSPAAFIFTYLMTILTLINFGWFREQICLIVCPYGRFQSVLQDSWSITVMYDHIRGEPRKGTYLPQTNPNQIDEIRQGDCVSCSRCVQVCPTGIDIRNGQQMECIACTACIDACDEIMEKVKKPKGLIRYGSLMNSTSFFRPRTLVYLFLIVASLSGLIYSLMGRSAIHFQILRNQEVPYSVLSAGEPGKSDLLMNQFRIHIINQTMEPLKLNIKVPEDWESKGIKIISQNQGELVLKPAEFKTIPFFVTFPPNLVKGVGTYSTQLTISENYVKFYLVGPR